MIFNSVNEEGEPAWKLILQHRKTITRRLKPVKTNCIRAVQPNRGKKAVGYIWIINQVRIPLILEKEFPYLPIEMLRDLEEQEAKREGFSGWGGLMDWFRAKYNPLPEYVYRIKFQLVDVKNGGKKNGKRKTTKD